MAAKYGSKMQYMGERDTTETYGQLRLPPELAIDVKDLRYVARPQDLLPYNHIEPLRDGEAAYPAMLEAISSAQTIVHLESYILRSDTVGKRFADALKNRAQAGVRVRVMYDSFGSMGIDDHFLTAMKNAGVQLLEYHPIAPWRRRFRLARRNHRKLLIVDTRVAFTGGLNIADDYAPEAQGGRGWHDMHARIAGPLIVEFERIFHATWTKEGGAAYDCPKQLSAVPAAPSQSALARVMHNKKFRQRFQFRRAYLCAINEAHTTVSIMNAYFVPDRRIRQALCRAAARGVNVRVIVPSQSDVKLVKLATQRLYTKLLTAGVRIFEWPERMMHAKTAVIDDVWSTIGSYNLDAISLRLNLEVAIAVIDRAFGNVMAKEFEADANSANEITLATWRGRPWWQKVLEWMAFRFRRWL